MEKRGKSKIVQVGLRIREELRAKLEEAADATGLSLNSEMVRRLEESFSSISRDEHNFIRKSLLRDMRTLLDLRREAEDRAKKAEGK